MKIWMIAALWLAAAASHAFGPEVAKKNVPGQPMTMKFDGPTVYEDGLPNPFADYRMILGVYSYKTRQWTMHPGYFDADGNSADTGATGGSIWTVTFTPDEPGLHFWFIDFQHGLGLGGEPYAQGNPISMIHHQNGQFYLAAGRPRDGHAAKRYAGINHFVDTWSRDGWVKAGLDSPENFLAFAEFDQTYDTGGFYNFIHRYESHAKDWREGDPTWAGGKGKSIIGALNYIKSTGMNSVYCLTFNLGGDGADVWPWTSPSERLHYDCSKLDQWKRLFAHADRLGIQIHIVFDETENCFALGSDADLRRRVYYRQMVARFGGFRNIQWNLGEEQRNSASQLQAFALYIRSIDGAKHPIAVHTQFGNISLYNSLYGLPYFDASSVQGNGSSYDAYTREIRNKSIAAGRPWAVYMDEQSPSNLHDVRTMLGFQRRNLVAGGAGVEFYGGNPEAGGTAYDLTLDDFRIFEPLWVAAGSVVRFLDFYDAAVHLASPTALGLEGPGMALLWLESGGSRQLSLAQPMNGRWMCPETRESLAIGQVQPSDTVSSPWPGKHSILLLSTHTKVLTDDFRFPGPERAPDVIKLETGR